MLCRSTDTDVEWLFDVTVRKWEVNLEAYALDASALQLCPLISHGHFGELPCSQAIEMWKARAAAVMAVAKAASFVPSKRRNNRKKRGLFNFYSIRSQFDDTENKRQIITRQFKTAEDGDDN